MYALAQMHHISVSDPIVKIIELVLYVASSNEHVALLAAYLRRQFNNIWDALQCVYRGWLINDVFMYVN